MYLIIPKIKVVIERDNIDDLEDHEEETLKNLMYPEEDDFGTENLMDTEINELTIGNIVSVYKCHQFISSLGDFSIDKMLLFWLKERDIEYQIEEEIDLDKYRKDEYIIVKIADE